MSKPPISTSRRILYWLIALVCIVLIAELICRAYYYRRNASSSLALIQLFKDSKKLVGSGLGGNQSDTAYRPDLKDDDRHKLAKENKESDRVVYEPWVQFYFRDYEGEFVNVKKGIRRSAPEVSDSSAKSPFTILFLGGSTMFGYNLRDEETIPSIFAKTYKERFPSDRPIRVINQGIPYYFSYQELMLLTHKLYTEKKPDMVIMLDGLNDCLQLYSAFYRQPYFSAAISKFVNPSLAELPEDYSYYSSPQGISDDSVFNTVSNNYLSNISTAKYLAESYGVELYCFWQPAPFHNYPNRAKDPACAKFERPAFDSIYPKIKSASEKRDYLFYLGDMLQNEKGTPFVDKTHYSVEMNRKIVEEIMKTLNRTAN